MARHYKPVAATVGLSSTQILGESAHRVGLYLVSQSAVDAFSIGLGADAVAGQGLTLIGVGQYHYLDRDVVGDLLTRRITAIGSAGAVVIAGYEVLER